jgi:flagellar hook protein FlgE
MIFGAIQTAFASMQAHQRAFAAHAQNVANVNTDGYRAVEATFESDSSGGVDVTFSRGPDPGSDRSGVDLAEEAVDGMMLEMGIKANMAVVREADEMLGSLLDVLG